MILATSAACHGIRHQCVRHVQVILKFEERKSQSGNPCFLICQNNADVEIVVQLDPDVNNVSFLLRFLSSCCKKKDMVLINEGDDEDEILPLAVSFNGVVCQDQNFYR